jgi:hypothetical protein
MSYSYLLARLQPSYAVSAQIKPRSSPGDGLKDLPSSPVWF